MGSSIKQKKLRESCNDKCRKKCCATISDAQRQDIFKTFYELGDITRKREYILRHIVRKESERKTEGSRKCYSNYYSLTAGGVEKFVCKKFFLNTLCISERTAFDKMSAEGMLEGEMRGRHGTQKIVAELAKAYIRKHIESFPHVPSHYCRQEIRRNYLSQELNIRRLYRLYVESCPKDKIVPEKECIYRNIFCEEYNLGFFQPKKDQCDLCTKFSNSDENERSEMKEQYDTHLRNKTAARKPFEKLRAQESPEHAAACFDLQQVLQCPYGNISPFYYSRKITVYTPG